MIPNFSFWLVGAIGALVRDLVEDRALDLPRIVNGKIFLGFIAGMIIGAFVGYVTDQNLLVSALAGYTGVSVIERLLTKSQ